jgi:hypothetical protein
MRAGMIILIAFASPASLILFCPRQPFQTLFSGSRMRDNFCIKAITYRHCGTKEGSLYLMNE